MAQHAFWIIVDGQTPTSFRARDKEDLLPTLTQLKRTQPQVVLMWFERGRLWASPEEARGALIVRRKAPERRPRTWRPGGDHVDPRAKYVITRDQKRARFKERLGRDQRETGEPKGPDAEPRPARPPYRPNRPDRPPYKADRPDRPPFRPGGADRPTRPARPPYRPDRDRPRRDADRPPGRDRGTPPPARSREAAPKPTGFGDRPWRPKKPWRPAKPKGGKG